MGHHITALLLKGNYQKEKAEKYDLFGIDLGCQITLFPIDHYYSACWQAKLQPLGIPCLQAIQQVGYFKELSAAAFFSKEGQCSKEIAVVNTGLLRIFYVDEAGREWNKAFLQTDDFLMANPNITEKSQVNIQTLETCQLYCISLKDYKLLTQQFPKLKDMFQQLLLEYLSKKQNREIALLTKNARQRYASFLKEFPDLEDRIPHYHIASYLGITPTQLSRIRKKEA